MQVSVIRRGYYSESWVADPCTSTSHVPPYVLCRKEEGLLPLVKYSVTQQLQKYPLLSIAFHDTASVIHQMLAFGVMTAFRQILVSVFMSALFVY